jgi:hypothetical protein
MNAFPSRPFDLEPLWVILACVGGAVFVGASLLAALRTPAGLSHIERLGVRAWPLWVALAILVGVGWAPGTVTDTVSPTVKAYLQELQDKISHAASRPDASPHLYPNARSIMLSGQAHGAPVASTHGASP